ncbi:MAG: rubrerythrin [Clostridia bacterium]|nr:rubrerythrin [Clostridia bacterium]
MDNKDLKAFISAQQGELNAVLMYQEFAKVTKNPELKAHFQEAARDEAKHAANLAKYTGETLKPGKAQAKLLGFLYRILPKRLIFWGISIGEYSGGNNYKKYIGDTYPEMESMMYDEYRHGDKAKEFSKAKIKK